MLYLCIFATGGADGRKRFVQSGAGDALREEPVAGAEGFSLECAGALRHVAPREEGLAVENAMTGRLVRLDIPWYETRINNCSFCGIMIAGQYWQDDDYPNEMFCTAACAEVKRRLAREGTGVGVPKRRVRRR
jgi:hypothetical protein